MERGRNGFPGYLYSDVPAEKAVIKDGLSSLSYDEIDALPEGSIRFDHLLQSASQDRFPGRYVAITGHPVPIRASEHQFMRVGPAELPLAIAAAQRIQREGTRKQKRIAGKMISMMGQELEAFRTPSS